MIFHFNSLPAVSCQLSVLPLSEQRHRVLDIPNLRAQVREPQQSLFYSSYVWSSEKARQIYKSTTGQKQTNTPENAIEG